MGVFTQIFVLRDFNAQNVIWGSTKNNFSSNTLGKYLSLFYFINNGSGTRISASKDYTSVLDISITNSTNLTLNWSVFDDPIGSDHLPIISITNESRISMDNPLNLNRDRIE